MVFFLVWALAFLIQDTVHTKCLYEMNADLLARPPSYTEENIKTQNSKLKLKIGKRFFNRGDVVVKELATENSREGSIRFHQMEIWKKSGGD